MSDVKLPEFKLNRNFTLISKTGLALRFEKGVPRPVHAQLVPEVLAIGAERVDAEQGEGMGDEKRPPEEPQGVEREDLIQAAIEDLVERNNSKDFNAGGVPKPVPSSRSSASSPSLTKSRRRGWPTKLRSPSNDQLRRTDRSVAC